MEDVLQEIEVIKSIYCGNEEIVIDEKGLDKVVISVQLKSAKTSVHITLTLILRPDYPSSAPSISVKSSSLVRGKCDKFKVLLEEKCDELKGEEMLFQLISFAYDYFEQHFIDQEKEMNLGQNSSLTYTSVLQLDHMRNRSQYCKIIDRWTKELNLVGRLIFCQKLILVLLQGDKEDIKKYICQNRSQLVDVDSRGRPCKERLLSVLMIDVTSYKKTFTDFGTWDVTSLKLLEEKFREVGFELLLRELKINV